MFTTTSDDDYPLKTLSIFYEPEITEAWSLKEAEAFFKWVMSIKQQRVSLLLRYLGVPFSDDYGHVIALAAQALVRVGREDPRLRNGRVASRVGHVVGGDVGLLLGEAFVAKSPSLHWGICTDSSISAFRRPVVSGFAISDFDASWIGVIAVQRAIEPEAARTIEDTYWAWLTPPYFSGEPQAT